MRGRGEGGSQPLCCEEGPCDPSRNPPFLAPLQPTAATPRNPSHPLGGLRPQPPRDPLRPRNFPGGRESHPRCGIYE